MERGRQSFVWGRAFQRALKTTNGVYRCTYRWPYIPMRLLKRVFWSILKIDLPNCIKKVLLASELSPTQQAGREFSGINTAVQGLVNASKQTFQVKNARKPATTPQNVCSQDSLNPQILWAVTYLSIDLPCWLTLSAPSSRKHQKWAQHTRDPHVLTPVIQTQQNWHACISGGFLQTWNDWQAFPFQHWLCIYILYENQWKHWSVVKGSFPLFSFLNKLL